MESFGLNADVIFRIRADLNDNAIANPTAEQRPMWLDGARDMNRFPCAGLEVG
jgi:hypothetical protein